MQSIINRHPSLPILLILFSLVLTSCLDSSEPEPLGNLYEEASAEPQFSSFMDYIDETELDAILADSSNERTIIIPVDEAISSSTLDTLSTESLTEILRYHMIDDIVSLQALDETEDGTDDIQSMQGEDLYFELESTTSGARLNINDSQALVSRQANNGVMYAVDQVLFPDSYLDVTGLIAKRYELNDLQDAIEEVAALEETLQDPDAEFTIFAPSDEALDGASPTGSEIEYYIVEEKLTSAELNSQTYPTMSGDELDVDASGTITINGEATVTTMDIEGTNGVVHIIDATLEAPSQ